MSTTTSDVPGTTQPGKLFASDVQVLLKRLEQLQIGQEARDVVLDHIGALHKIIESQETLLKALEPTTELMKEFADLKQQIARVEENDSRTGERLARLEKVHKERGLYIAESQKRWAAEKQALLEQLSQGQAQIDEFKEEARRFEESSSRRLAQTSLAVTGGGRSRASRWRRAGLR